MINLWVQTWVFLFQNRLIIFLFDLILVNFAIVLDEDELILVLGLINDIKIIVNFISQSCDIIQLIFVNTFKNVFFFFLTKDKQELWSSDILINSYYFLFCLSHKKDQQLYRTNELSFGIYMFPRNSMLLITKECHWCKNFWSKCLITIRCHISFF